MSSSRFPKGVLKRYTELLLHHIHLSGGRERFVPVAEIEDTLGLEPELILQLCRTRLLGEVQVADRLPAELEEGTEFHAAFERQAFRLWFCQPHVRIRPRCVRLTEEELVRKPKRRRKRRT